MSLECPCIYWNNGKCKKFSGEGIVSWCVEGPCGEMRPSNADRIRAMNDEELADMLDSFNACNRCRRMGNDCFPASNTLEWLKQPAEDK